MVQCDLKRKTHYHTDKQIKPRRTEPIKQGTGVQADKTTVFSTTEKKRKKKKTITGNNFESTIAEMSS